MFGHLSEPLTLAHNLFCGRGFCRSWGERIAIDSGLNIGSSWSVSYPNRVTTNWFVVLSD